LIARVREHAEQRAVAGTNRLIPQVLRGKIGKASALRSSMMNASGRAVVSLTGWTRMSSVEAAVNEIPLPIDERHDQPVVRNIVFAISDTREKTCECEHVADCPQQLDRTSSSQACSRRSVAPVPAAACETLAVG